MRVVVFGPHARVGAEVEGRIVDLNGAFTAMLREQKPTRAAINEASWRVPAALADLIDRGDAGLDDAAAAIDYATTEVGVGSGVVFERDRVALHAPTVYRPRIACAASNYAAHALGSAVSRAPLAATNPSDALAGLFEPEQIPTIEEIVDKTRRRGAPRGFWKDFANGVGPESDVTAPSNVELFDYEGEVAAVIGRAARHVRAGQARPYLWGMTLVCDFSIRGGGKRDSLTFNPAKNFDHSAAVGPAVLVGDFDPQDVRLTTTVNGELRQDFGTSEMIFSFAEFVEHLSETVTLQPGDMISGGSGAGTAVDSSTLRPGATAWPDDLARDRFLSPGDLVEIASPAVGTLRNRIVA